MHWQAKFRNGHVETGDAQTFHLMDPSDVEMFCIVAPHVGWSEVVWASSQRPKAYTVRETPNETVHVLDMGTDKVFVFEGTNEVITQTKWGHGVFAPITQPAPKESFDSPV